MMCDQVCRVTGQKYVENFTRNQTLTNRIKGANVFNFVKALTLAISRDSLTRFSMSENDFDG